MGVAVGQPSQVESVVETARDAVGSEPLLVAAVGLAVLLALVVLALVIRRLRRTRGESFRRAIAARDSLSVLMHSNPDPDAMACALAVREIAESVGTETTLLYPGEIRHQENRAFITVLDLDFQHFDHADELPTDDIVLVDHNTARGFDGDKSLEPVAVVDHHPGGGVGSTFTDVRTDVGACASIFAEYCQQLDWEPGSPEGVTEESNGIDGVLSTTVATGLVYGIQSDTSNLTKGCSQTDFAAVSYLYSGVDQDQLDRIANPEVDAEVLDVKARAIDVRDVRNAFAVSDVGTVSNVDAIPQAADELLRLEGVTAVVVLGDRDGELHVSGRSRDDRVHIGNTLRDIVSDIPRSGAGGHARMGGGQISLAHLEGIGPAGGFTREEFVDHLFDAMAGEV